MDSQVLAPDPFVQPLKLGAEVSPLDVEIQNSSVIHQNTEGSVCQVSSTLPQDLVQHSPVRFGKGQEFPGIGGHFLFCRGGSLRRLLGLQLTFLLFNVSKLFFSRLFLVVFLLLFTGSNSRVNKEESFHSRLKHQHCVMVWRVRQLLQAVGESGPEVS